MQSRDAHGRGVGLNILTRVKYAPGLTLLDHILDGPRGSVFASTRWRHSGHDPIRRSSTSCSCLRTIGKVHRLALRGEKRSVEREERVRGGA
jgi:hypothetical protein